MRWSRVSERSRVFCNTSCCCFFFQAEDGIRDLVRSRGLGDVYKRQAMCLVLRPPKIYDVSVLEPSLTPLQNSTVGVTATCLLYTSDAADDLPCVDLGGRRIIKTKNKYKKTFHI